MTVIVVFGFFLMLHNSYGHSCKIHNHGKGTNGTQVWHRLYARLVWHINYCNINDLRGFSNLELKAYI